MIFLLIFIISYFIIAGTVKYYLDEKIKRLEAIEEMRLEGWDVRELIKREENSLF